MSKQVCNSKEFGLSKRRPGRHRRHGAIAVLALFLMTSSQGALSQLMQTPAQLCSEIDAEFDRRIEAMDKAVAPTPAQSGAWLRFERAVKAAHQIMIGPCSAGVSGVALQMKMMSIGPQAMAMIKSAADDVGASLTPPQRERLAAVMQ
jgi:LTXXQ motif family protein